MLCACPQFLARQHPAKYTYVNLDKNLAWPRHHNVTRDHAYTSALLPRQMISEYLSGFTLFGILLQAGINRCNNLVHIITTHVEACAN